jgi:hypothetical protein
LDVLRNQDIKSLLKTSENTEQKKLKDYLGLLLAVISPNWIWFYFKFQKTQ